MNFLDLFRLWKISPHSLKKTTHCSSVRLELTRVSQAKQNLPTESEAVESVMRGRVKLERKPPASFFLNFFLCFHAAPAGTLDLVDLPAGCGFFQRRLTSRCGLVTAPQRPCELARARAHPPISAFPASETTLRRVDVTASHSLDPFLQPYPPLPFDHGIAGFLADEPWDTNARRGIGMCAFKLVWFLSRTELHAMWCVLSKDMWMRMTYCPFVELWIFNDASEEFEFNCVVYKITMKIFERKHGNALILLQVDWNAKSFQRMVPIVKCYH